MTTSAALLPWWKEPTKDHWIAFAAAWFGWVLDAFDFTVFILVMPKIREEFTVSSTYATLSIALTLLLRLVGGMVAGWAADRWGRRLPLLISIVWFAACDFAIAFAGSFETVLILRTLFGFGMGAEWTAGATLAMEQWPKRSRGIASGVLQGSWAVGYFLAAIAAAYIVPVYGWRGLFIAAALPALLIFPLMWFVKEPPHIQAAAADKTVDTSFGALLKAPGVLSRLVWGSAAMAAGLAAYYALIGNYPDLLKSFGHDISGISFHVALFNIGMMIGAIACGFIAMKRGVAPAILIPTIAMAICVPLYVGASPGLLAVGAFLGGLFGAGYSGTTPLLLTSLFPDHLRAKAVGIVYHVGAVPAAFVPMSIAAMHEKGGLSWGTAIAIVVALSVLGLAALVALGPAEVKAKPSPDAVAH